MKEEKKSYLDSFLSALENSTAVGAMRRGLVLIIPILFIGSLCTVLLSLPVQEYQVWLQEFLQGGFLKLLYWIYNATMGMVSLYAVFGISYHYASQIRREDMGFYMIASIASFVLYTEEDITGTSLEIFRADWMFTAILITLISCKLVRYFLEQYRRINDQRYSRMADMDFHSILAATLPIGLTLLVILGLKGVMFQLLGGNIQNVGSLLAAKVFEEIGSGPLGALVFIFLIHFLWFFGIHGSNMLYGVSVNLFEGALVQNAALVEAGQAPVHIFSKTFIDSFVLMGGSGTTICLLLAMIIFSIRYQDKNYKKISGMALIPGIFNVNEIILFGLPVVFNPIMLIPFVAVPILMIFTSGIAMSVGLVPIPSARVMWTVPVLFSGYLSTSSIRGVVLQLANIAIGAAVYYPFLKLSRQYYDKILKDNIAKLKQELVDCEENGKAIDLESGPQKKRDMVKMLEQDLESAIAKNDLRLHYQPQVRNDGSIYGAEALLRWNHPVAGYLYPPMIIELARQMGILDELGMKIIKMVAEDLEALAAVVSYPIHIAVNISPVQFENMAFYEQVKEVLGQYDFGECTLCFEVTEQLALSNSKLVAEQIEELKGEGIPFHMDDFGMGHSSMKYLQSNEFEAIKVDGSLVQHILDNPRSRDIINGIQRMASPLHYELIAEYVETAEQKEELEKLGCNIYQGTLYSWPVPFESLKSFLEKYGAIKKDKNIEK